MVSLQGSINPSTRQDDTSSSEDSEDELPAQYMPPYPREANQQLPPRPAAPLVGSSEDEGADSADDLPSFHPNATGAGIARPSSGVSRYRTPMGMSAGAPASYTPPVGGFPAHPHANHQAPQSHQPQILPAQPLPRYSTPSAFSPPTDDRNLSSASPSIPSSFPTTSLSYPAHLSHSHFQPYSFRGPGGAANSRQPPGVFSSSEQHPLSQSGLPIEQAVESMQASLAALRERLEGLETHAYGSNPALVPRILDGSSSPAGGVPGSGNGLPARTHELHWDPHHMGLWSIVLVPAAHVVNQIKYVLILILSNPSPQRGRGSGGRRDGGINVRAIARRLILDASFVVAAFMAARAAWRASGIRRREVLRALQLVWVALIGRPPRRMMVDRGVQS